MGLFNRKSGDKKAPEPLPQDKKPITENTKSNPVDVNKPVENPRLKALIRQYDQDKSDDTINSLLEEIAENAHFLSVITLSEEPEQGANGTAVFKKGTTMQFPMLTTQDDQSFYPVFTDWVELGKWQGIQSPKTLILSFDDYAAMVLQDEQTQGVVINPFSDNMTLNRELIKHIKTRKDILTKGVSPQVVTKDTEVLLGEPENYPTEMVDAISSQLKGQPNVNRAWLHLMIKDNEQSYLLVVDFSGDRQATFRGIADAARPYLSGMYIDMIPYQDDFGESAVKNAAPFYQR